MVVMSRLLDKHVHETSQIVTVLEATKNSRAMRNKVHWRDKKILITAKQHELDVLRKDAYDEN